ncbi:NADPH-dependent FMN reductase [Herbaspirillum sp. RV1423]|uniref:NADPH-dependent FMN reductase n=1 Tax=Herbaspirillum sp. RV1423 TaxID=1443993 RepID=UPI001E29B9AF|nr:NADPH-dependent FMN reductase [Herbaspirillum sp. RV1423]
MKKVLLIMGSTRAGRKCPQITSWVKSLAKQVCPDFSYEIVDLATWQLPMDDEPGIPALGNYTQAHTLAWSEKIKAAAAVAFITPQFNWGYPAVLKNAIDHLYSEWREKPTIIVTYGGHGGTRCARQLRRVAASLRMNVVLTAPALELPDLVIREGAALNPAQDFRASIPKIERAFTELANQINDRESMLSTIKRKLKALLASIS